MLTGVALCLTFCCWFGHGRIFWEDEMLGWMLLHDPSWRHLIAAWKMGADRGGFAFYLLGRAWFTLFGASDLSFRLISASCFALGFCVTWQAARRYYSTTPVAFALFTTWFLCPPMVMHMVEGRFYGLLVLATSLAAWVVLVACQQRPTRWWLYGVAFAVNGLLTTTHTLGIVYSAFLLIALVVVDRSRKQLRPLLYVAVACSWLLLWPERAAIAASARVGKPWFWTFPPDAIRFVGAFCGFSNLIAFVLFLMLAALFYTLRKQAPGIAGQAAGTAGEASGTAHILRTAFRERRPVYCVSGALFCVPLLLGMQAHLHGTSLFINRYLLPVNIGLALIMAEIFRLMRWDLILPSRHWFPLTGRSRTEAIAAFAAVLLLCNVIHVQPYTLGSVDYTGQLTALLPKNIPVVFEDAWGFTEMIGTQHSSGVQYLYMLDWPHSIDPAAPRLEVTQYHLMENWKNAGYFSGSIQYRDDFLRHYRKFLVLQRAVDATDRNGIIIGNPLVKRFAHTPGAQVTRLRRSLFGYNVWLVCTEACSGETAYESGLTGPNSSRAMRHAPSAQPAHPTAGYPTGSPHDSTRLRSSAAESD